MPNPAAGSATRRWSKSEGWTRLRLRAPRVSIFLCTKDGMPYVREAVESVKAQTYRDFELVIDDGASTDGTIEYLESIEGVPHVDFASAPHTGVGQARNRAVHRCRGAIVGSIDQDNLLEPDAIERAVAAVEETPHVACVYGGSKVIGEDGTLLRPFMPGEFDLLKVLYNELVPSFASAFFVQEKCGGQLRFDEEILRCEDYDLWLRVSHLPIRRVELMFGSTRLSDASATRASAKYDDFVGFKSEAAERFLARAPDGPVADAVRRRTLAGILLWAAESVYELEQRRTEQYERYVAEAAALDPVYDRLDRARERS